MKERGDMPSQRVFRRVGAALPPGFLAYFAKKMMFAGITDDPRVWLGRTLLFAFFAGSLPMAAYLAIYNPIATPATELIVAELFLGGFLLISFLYYLVLYFSIADRATAVEKILPDFLSLTVSNLRAGMSPFAAFVHAARPEFGVFHHEVMLATARTGAKASIVDALSDVADHFDSGVLRRTVALFAKGMRSGGQLVRLLNASADEVRRIQDLRSELASSTRTYSIFLGFIVILAMPFLLAVSTHFVATFVKIQKENVGLAAGSTAGIPTFSGQILISSDDMQLISLLTIFLTSLLVSALIGVVNRGKALYGVKYFPLILVASVLVYFLARGMVSGILAGFGG
jgi:pilus assembly protein TadC